MQSLTLRHPIITLLSYAGLLIVGFSISFVAFTIVAHATGPDDIVYPVSGLGDCKNKDDCRAYCDQAENHEQCIKFARKHKLFSERQLKRAEAVSNLSGRLGPGGCEGLDACEAYCSTGDHMVECIEFAKRHGLMERDELKKAEKVAEALRGGATLPGGCSSKESCGLYCSDDAHLDECTEFAHRVGFISDKDREIVRKTGGRGPGNCRREECDNYCKQEAHFDECLAFAQDHGLISQKELEIARKTGGVGPGGCRGKDCKYYCEREENFDECLTFAKKHDFISDKEFELAERTGGVGPGGCRGEECKTYCEDPNNQEKCLKFASEHDLIPQGDLRVRQEGADRLKDVVNQAPPELAECLRTALGPELVGRLKNGEVVYGREIGEQTRRCQEQLRTPTGRLDEPSRDGGPTFHDGDSPAVQPFNYNTDYKEQGEVFEPQYYDEPSATGSSGPTFSGRPGGCSTPEECRVYCSDPVNAAECGLPFQGADTSAEPPHEQDSTFQEPLYTEPIARDEPSLAPVVDEPEPLLMPAVEPEHTPTQDTNEPAHSEPSYILNNFGAMLLGTVNFLMGR